MRLEGRMMWACVPVLCSIFLTAQSQTIDTILGDCTSRFYYITQPPSALPCNPYSSVNPERSSLRLECSALVPANLTSSSSIVWSKALEDGNVKSLNDGDLGKRLSIMDSVVLLEGANDNALRSILELGSLTVNDTTLNGRYFCQVRVERPGEEPSFSNASTPTLILDSTEYASIPKCIAEQPVFLTLNPVCLGFNSSEGPITLPPITTPTVCSDCETCTQEARSPLSTEAVVIISSVGGGLGLLVCILLLILTVTCCCVRRAKNSKSSLRTFKDRTIPLSASMSNINIIENANSHSNLIAEATPHEIPFTHPSPSYPPPVHTTLPTHLKQSVIQTNSNEGSVASSTAVLIHKGRAATVIGKLKNACTPTGEEEATLGDGTTLGQGPQYKSLIKRNMDSQPIYNTAAVSLNGSLESLNIIKDGQPVYTEPTIPLSVSMLSLVSVHNRDEDDQPEYSEPMLLPHSFSSYSLHSQVEAREDWHMPRQARARMSLPLNQKMLVNAMTEEEEDIYDEVLDLEPEELASPMKQTSSVESSPTRAFKKRPIVPPRPEGRKGRKISQQEPLLKHQTTQPDFDTQRESVDGEYVCPNSVELGGGQRSNTVVQLANGDITPPHHQRLGSSDRNQEYLTLFVPPDN